MRNRARYEVANNSYARGISLTLANDTIGIGPRLQMTTADSGQNRVIEAAFSSWAREIRLAEKLRTMRMARFADGEAFALLVNNPALPIGVHLDLRLVEADQIATPVLSSLKPNQVDGIELDALGNPVAYHVLKHHPGDLSAPMTDRPMRVDAGYVLHDFRPDRPCQHRGLPEVMPALPLFAYLRRYTLAVIAAAESAANQAMVIQSRQPAGMSETVADAYDLIEFQRNMATVLPEGYEIGGFKPEQPTTAHADFVRAVILEIARCLNMPFCIAAGDSSSYNYASGRLDHQTYLKSIEVDRSRIEDVILNRVFEHWLREYLSDRSGIAPGDIDVGLYAHQWFWTGREHVDPKKVADADETNLRIHATTLASIYAREGRDWENELRQRSKERELLRVLGLEEAETLPRRAKDDAAKQILDTESLCHA